MKAIIYLTDGEEDPVLGEITNFGHAESFFAIAHQLEGKIEEIFFCFPYFVSEFYKQKLYNYCETNNIGYHSGEMLHRNRRLVFPHQAGVPDKDQDYSCFEEKRFWLLFEPTTEHYYVDLEVLFYRNPKTQPKVWENFIWWVKRYPDVTFYLHGVALWEVPEYQDLFKGVDNIIHLPRVSKIEDVQSYQDIYKDFRYIPFEFFVPPSKCLTNMTCVENEAVSLLLE